MAITDRHGLPIAVGIASASPHEVTLVDATLDQRFVHALPERLIGDKAYDSNGLDERLRAERGQETGGLENRVSCAMHEAARISYK